MNLRILKLEEELQEESDANQQLHMRRPPNRLPPLQEQQQMMDDNQGVYQEQIT